MINKYFKIILFLLPISLFSGVVGPMEMARDLEAIEQLVKNHYGPIDWKANHHRWNLDKKITAIKSSLNKATTPEQYQQKLKNLFDSTNDFHVGISFFSTKEAFLPFTLRSADENVYVVLAKEETHLEKGDRVLYINNENAIDVLKNYAEDRFSSLTPSTLALAEIGFTRRLGSRGHPMPSESQLLLVVEKCKTKELISIVYDWKMEEEQMVHLPRSLPYFSLSHAMNKRRFIPDECEAFMARNAGQMGMKKSFLPKLGPVLWAFPSLHYDAYIYLSDSGKPIGFIRISDYMHDEEEVIEFAQIIKVMQKQTHALVIDQLNNPGGMMSYLYDLLSFLTDKPLSVPVHQERITEDNVAMAVKMLKMLEEFKTEEDAIEFFGETSAGSVVTLEFLEKIKNYCHFLKKEYRSGHTLTEPYPFFGIDVIDPNPKVNYTKPLIVLINELDFSCGDFFPAILQDNGRAVLFGRRTAGAGGYVKEYQHHGLFGVEMIRLTGSIAKRINGQPIEDLGVEPDIAYELTDCDLSENFADYVKAVNQVVEQLTKG